MQRGSSASRAHQRRRTIEYTDITVHIDELRKNIVPHRHSRGQHAATTKMAHARMIQASLLHGYATASSPLVMKMQGLSPRCCTQLQ